MERRYKLMSTLGVRNLSGFNQKVAEAREARRARSTNPFTLDAGAARAAATRCRIIVVVIDELADLMMVVGKKVEELIARLAQKARAAGIHLILATQRPSVDVITGLIKANIPTRIAFQVSRKIDSRTILDQMGAEALLGQGDMLYLPPGTGLPQRVHGAFVADEEVHKVVDHLKPQGEPQVRRGRARRRHAGRRWRWRRSKAAADGGESDPLYDQAVAIVLQHRARPSISLVQRHLRIGYNRAARLIEQMERAGMVSPMQTNGNREVLVPAKARVALGRMNASLRPSLLLHCCRRLGAQRRRRVDALQDFVAATRSRRAPTSTQTVTSTDGGKTVQQVERAPSRSRARASSAGTTPSPFEQMIVGDGETRLDLRQGPEPGHGAQAGAARSAPARRRCSPAAPSSRSASTLDATPAARRPRVAGGDAARRRTAGFERIRMGFGATALEAMELRRPASARRTRAPLHRARAQPEARRRRRSASRRPRAPT